MSLDYSAAHLAIARAVSEDQTMPAFWEAQGTQEIEAPYFTLALTSVVPVGLEEVRYTFPAESRPFDEEVDATTIQWFDITVTAKPYLRTEDAVGANAAMSHAMKLVARLRTQHAFDLLEAANLGLHDVNLRAINATEVIQAVWQPRAVVEFKCWAADSAVERLGYIATLTATQTWDEPEPDVVDTVVIDLEQAP